MKRKKVDWITLWWLFCLVAIAFLAGRISAEVPAPVNAQEMTEVAPVQQNYDSLCEKVGAEYHICPELLEAMIEQESEGNPKAVSPSGDMGLLQVNPKWHKDRMDKLGVNDLTDPYGNVRVAADYIAELFVQYDDLPMVLMVYNGTADAEQRWTSGEYTDYANQIMTRAAELEREHGK
jgi:soluble lytic murein transglycosylase-like protein